MAPPAPLLRRGAGALHAHLDHVEGRGQHLRRDGAADGAARGSAHRGRSRSVTRKAVPRGSPRAAACALTCATMPLLAPAQKRCHSRGSAFAPHTAARAAGYSPTPTPAISDVRPSAGTTPR